MGFYFFMCSLLLLPIMALTRFILDWVLLADFSMCLFHVSFCLLRSFFSIYFYFSYRQLPCWLVSFLSSSYHHFLYLFRFNLDFPFLAHSSIASISCCRYSTAFVASHDDAAIAVTSAYKYDLGCF